MGFLDALRGGHNDAIRHSTSVTMAYLLAQNRKFEAFMRHKVEELEARVAAQQARLSAGEPAEATGTTLPPLPDMADIDELVPGGSFGDKESNPVGFDLSSDSPADDPVETMAFTSPVGVTDTPAGEDLSLDEPPGPPDAKRDDWQAALIGAAEVGDEADAPDEDLIVDPAATTAQAEPAQPAAAGADEFAPPVIETEAPEIVDPPPPDGPADLAEGEPDAPDEAPIFTPSWLGLTAAAQGDTPPGVEAVDAPAVATLETVDADDSEQIGDDQPWESPMNDGTVEDWT